MAYAPSAHPHRGAAHRVPPPASNAPPGTFLPGTKVQVGSQRVIIEKYLSEGGFAHVYVARVPRENNKHEIAVLKRVAVPDKDHLASMRTEVETMKKLKGHRHIVTYMDSHASQLNGGGYEVFLLMEFCSGGGLIDFMNTRLQHRLTEPEILKIFGDVAEGVACMHYLKPPLLHRDLKVENVLISKSESGSTMYKLCDFGSTAAPRPAASTPEEGRLIEEDVQKHTTMQYRSPEMIDVWRKQPIDEKADIWALGVLLYKLCYYTTPFEEVGQMAILNASFKYPSYPQFSDKLKQFIGWMLKEDPRNRPNIYQVIKEVCGMRGTAIPIKDIYADRTPSEARRTQTLPSREGPTSSSGPIGLQKASSRVDAPRIPDIAPMRRGRPTSSTTPQQLANSAQPSPSPARGDPFAALDSKNNEARAGAVDELSKRFPRLDEFSIAHDPSGRFQFDKSAPVASPPEQSNADDRVAHALADDLFASSKPQAEALKSHSTPQLDKKPMAPSAKPRIAEKVRDFNQQSPLMHQPTPVRHNPNYKSTATGSSPPPASTLRKPTPMDTPELKMPEISKRPIWRVPDHSRSTSVPRAWDPTNDAVEPVQSKLQAPKRPNILDTFRSKSHTSASAKSPTSSRPSLEMHRPSQLEVDEPSFARAQSAQMRQRPSSVYVSSNLEFLRDQETARKSSVEIRRSMDKSRSRQSSPRLMAFDTNEQSPEDANIENDLDYLRSNEEAENSKRRHSKQGASGHKKRSSIPSIANAKNIFAGRFGDAFKRFEQTPGEERVQADERPRTPEAPQHGDPSQSLSPIQGSEPTPSRYLDETEDVPPEVRREFERQQLVQEERRVAEAAAQYRANVTANGTGNSAHVSRASTIQKRVQSLLDEGRKSPVAPRTAEGYGKFTNQPGESANQPLPPRPSSVNKPTIPLPSRQIPVDLSVPGLVDPRVRPQSSGHPLTQTASAPPIAQNQRIVSRPSAPPKPKVLRTGQWQQTQEQQQQPELARPLSAKPTGLAALLAKDLEGVPDYPGQEVPPAARYSDNVAPRGNQGLDLSDATHDLEADFSARYPSLHGIEMVEREIGSRDVREV